MKVYLRFLYTLGYTVKIRIPILYHQIELECQFSCLKVNAPTLLDDLTPKTASEYHKKSPKQRVEVNFFNLKTLYILFEMVLIIVILNYSHVGTARKDQKTFDIQYNW